MTRSLLPVLILSLAVTPLWGQTWWGNLISANDTYSDVDTGDSLSCRFVAPWSGAVTAAAFPVTSIPPFPINDVGTASLQADDGTGLPSGVSLASVPATLLSNWNRILLPNVTLSAGATYHFVYAVGSSGTVRFKSSDVHNLRWIPSANTVNAAWNALVSFSGSWFVGMRDPAFVLEFADGRSYGNPYNDNSPILNFSIGGGSPLLGLHDNGTPGAPGDDACAGQVFRTPGSGVCRAYGFELKEFMSQAPNAPLEWTLEEAVSGFDVATGSVMPTAGLWLPATFASPVTLWAQRDYRLWFKSAQPQAAPHYLSCAWHAGTGAEWNDLTWQGTAGRAQSSADGGATWTDHPGGDLAFRMDIDTSPLPEGRSVPLLYLSRNRLLPGESLTLRIETAAEGSAYLAIYNSAGERVKELVREDLSRGTTRDLTWDTKNEQGELVASGLYLAQLASPGGSVGALFIVLR